MDDRKITIAVCGDSFCSASVVDLRLVGLRAHFSQILEDQYGYNILYYAHGGFSNRAILFQIEAAVRQQPDVIVYNTTWNSRIELFIKDKFLIDSGMHNFIYYDRHAESTNKPYTGNKESSILSTVWQGIDQNPNFTITAEQKKAVDLYLKYLFHDGLETSINQWLFEYWHERIIKNNIFPINLEDPDVGKIAYDFSFANQTYDTPFHTDRATQEIIAANIHRKIVDNFSQQK